MKITTSKGQTFEANWAWPEEDTQQLRIELQTSATALEIATAFEGLEKISRESEDEGDAVYEGYDTLTVISKNRNRGTALLILERSNAHD